MEVETIQTSSQSTTLYDADFYAWTQQQAKFLQARNVEVLDFENLAEEIESLGKQAQQELCNRLGILLGHLLKWHYQPKRRSASWFYTMLEQRKRILRHLKANPSLKSYLSEAIADGYEDGLYIFGKETGLDYRKLPQSCPFSVEQIFEAPIEFPEPSPQRTTQNRQPKL